MLHLDTETISDIIGKRKIAFCSIRFFYEHFKVNVRWFTEVKTDLAEFNIHEGIAIRSGHYSGED